ncbi:MAG: T9SS type A sorting domain-containing protein [Candidatus Eisenbacteria bacterium]|uniref:T9SS type A sorting domain-containing protein n=1 Tax=Eiseniibacteriota bacterium TaxID=2212470 RepID=A0A948W5K8_UNCEI|nr:T9SS type A sorting domain-containing protein [Candidatus Eisenbacteria bacterium]MBU1947329.1 T9SS type A sorting domain-containing protein [Candidatus Eisenbacteria bacterium]MBU2690519.1 T9SS type A sorting domain-containing protein [Candidatus Eisenbacteria bacterium]
MMCRFSAVLILTAFLLSPVQVLGIQESLPSEFEIPIPRVIDQRAYDPAFDQALSLLDPGWQSFINGEGKGWIVTMWAEETGLPAFAMGPGLPCLSNALSDGRQVEEAARRFIEGHSSLFGVGSDQLELESFLDHGGKQHLIFRQTYQGIPIVPSQLHMSFQAGLLVAFGSEVYPDLDLYPGAGIDLPAAVAAGTSGLPWKDGTDALRSNRLVVLAIPMEDATAFFLSYELILETKDPEGFWRTYVDASDGELLGRINEIAYGTFSGDVKSDVLFHPAGEYIEMDMPDLRVSITGGDVVYTDSDGDYSGSGPDLPANVKAEMWGRYARVYDDEDQAYDEISATCDPGVPHHFKFDDTNTNAAERSCFYHTNIVHSWIKNVDPAFTSLDGATLCRVNIATSSCNAFWNGNAINFYREGGGCVNMATMPEVIYHEYGHAITQYTYAPSPAPTSSGMGEAFSDYIGMTITDEPIMGEGYLGGSGWMRTGENLRQYPGTECGGEVHCLGEITMGALWKTRVAMIDKFGHDDGITTMDDLFRRTHQTKKTNIPAFLSQLIVEDDDNGNPADGSPDYYEICDAFAIHNVICPSLTIYVDVEHEGLGDTGNTLTPYEVVADIESISAGAFAADSIRIFYSLDGVSFSSVPMTETGTPHEYRGEIPAQPAGTVVDYYIRAVTENNVAGTNPFRAPEKGVNQFLVGYFAERLNGGLESHAGWIESAVDDDATDGFWEWGDPEVKLHPTTADTIQPAYDHSPDGVNCYVTRNMGGFWTNGNVNSGQVTLTTPALDLTTAEGGGFVEFWFFMADYNVADDTLFVDISGDGLSWHPLARINNPEALTYNTWTRFKAYFRDTDIDFTSNVQVRFIAKDDPNNSILEAAIDDLVVTVNDLTGADVGNQPAAPAVFRVEPARPNPFGPRTVFQYQIPETSPVKIEIFNVQGERVRVLADKTQPPGVYEMVFDGRSRTGRPLPSGLYFARVRAGAQVKTFTMAILR